METSKQINARLNTATIAWIGEAGYSANGDTWTLNPVVNTGFNDWRDYRSDALGPDWE